MKSLLTFIKEGKHIENAPEANAFVILKPEFDRFAPQFYSMLLDNNWQIIQEIKMTLSLETARELYKMHKDKDFYEDLCKYMASGISTICACYKDCKDPIKNMENLKDKFRNDFGKTEMKNGMHSSDSLANVKREIDLIFKQ